jgi:hypothetical protein
LGRRWVSFEKFRDMGWDRGYHFNGVYLMMISILWDYIGVVLRASPFWLRTE